MRLWRATAADNPHFAHGSCWATDREHGEVYRTLPGFGGPTLYRTDVGVDAAEVLDLRNDPWGTIGELFGLDRDDYDCHPDLEYELLRDLIHVFQTGDYVWLTFTDTYGETWIYLGTEPLTAAAVGPADAGRAR